MRQRRILSVWPPKQRGLQSKVPADFGLKSTLRFFPRPIAAAHTAHRLDQRRRRRVGHDALAQLRDVHVEGARLGEVVASPQQRPSSARIGVSRGERPIETLARSARSSSGKLRLRDFWLMMGCLFYRVFWLGDFLYWEPIATNQGSGNEVYLLQYAFNCPARNDA